MILFEYALKACLARNIWFTWIRFFKSRPKISCRAYMNNSILSPECRCSQKSPKKTQFSRGAYSIPQPPGALMARLYVHVRRNTPPPPPPPETRPAHGLHDSLPELNYVPPPELIQCISTLLMQYRIIHTFIFSSNNSTLKQLNTLPSQNAFKTAVVIISASYFTCAIILTETIFYMYPVGKLLLFVLVALST